MGIAYFTIYRLCDMAPETAKHLHVVCVAKCLNNAFKSIYPSREHIDLNGAQQEPKINKNP